VIPKSPRSRFGLSSWRDLFRCVWAVYYKQIRQRLFLIKLSLSLSLSLRASKDRHCFFGLQTSSHSPGPRIVTWQ